MTNNESFGHDLSRWLHEDGEHRVPDHLMDALLETAATRQRPWWTSLERWLPLETTFQARTAPIPRVAWATVVVAALVLSIAMFMVVGPGQRRLPHFGAAANGEIAFIDGGTLEVADPDGSNVRSVAALPNGAERLTFSPDGTHLAYRTADASPSIVVAEADGSGAIVVAAGPESTASGPSAWSPDSRRIAFTALAADGTGTIEVMDADGSDRRQVFADWAPPADRFDPAWSPDGHWISYFSNEANGYVGLNVVHADGTGAMRLPTSPLNPELLQARWSPDPRENRIAYVAGGYVKIWDLATSAETTAGTGFWPTWSPDGRSVAWFGDGTHVAAFTDLLVGNHRSLLLFPPINDYCQVDPHSQGMAQSRLCGPAEWSPDGAWVYGPDATGTTLLFAPSDGSKAFRTITLDHPLDLSLDLPGYVAWQPVAP